MAINHLNFFSENLMMNTDVNIILPNPRGNNVSVPSGESAGNFYSSGEKFRTLLLLHGRWEDYTSWIRCTNIETYACENKLIVVMPSGLNSNYMDWPNYGLGLKYTKFLAEELMVMIHNWFPSSSRREDNYVAGHSMGGCGAMKLSVLYPEMFSKCATISSNERKYPEFYEKNLKKGNKSVTNWIDAAGGIDLWMNRPENVRGTIEKMSDAEINALPEYYMAIGGNDDAAHISQFTEWAEFCEKHKLKVTSHIESGYGHDGYYFDKELRNIFGFLGLNCNGGENG